MEYLKLLGFAVRDRVTGFEGVVSSIAFDLYGCIQAAVTPTMKEGKLGEGHWFDAKRLETQSETPVMTPPAFATAVAGAENGPADKPAAHQLPIR